MPDSDDRPKTNVAPYLNSEFLKSPDARVIRIISEYLEPAARFRRYHIRDTVVFFGSARSLPPEEAAAQLAHIDESIAQAASMTEELATAKAQAETAVKLARYYEDAMELARRLTEWSKGVTANRHFIICSGGSGGMMEAANRGASSAAGKTIGLNILLPREQEVNPYVSRELVFNFHYFFMRKFWFVYPAKALVVFPGGFGTMDELFEVLTLVQTKMPHKAMPIILFGTEFWDEVLNFDALVRWGVVTRDELSIFHKTDSVDDAFRYITSRLEQLYLTPGGLQEVKLT
ncbi:MAG TPA: LOG family protein [Blastocatellia bacterium]|nr:LOG family protein [Blastocatellia bacterium]